MTDDELKKLYAHPGWQWCTSEGAELATLLEGKKMTLREKVQFCEDAETLYLRFAANHEAQRRRAEQAQAHQPSASACDLAGSDHSRE